MWLMLWLLVSLAIPVQQAPAGAAAQTPQAQAEAQSSKIWLGRNAEFEEFLKTAKIERTTGTGVGVLAIRHGYSRRVVWRRARPSGGSLRPARWVLRKLQVRSRRLQDGPTSRIGHGPSHRRDSVRDEPASLQLWVKNTRMLSEIQKVGARDPMSHGGTGICIARRCSTAWLAISIPMPGIGCLMPCGTSIKIDCSRCFTDTATLQFDPKKVVQRIDRPFFERIKALDRETVRREISPFLTENGALPGPSAGGTRL